jgi:hypothetical protein
MVNKSKGKYYGLLDNLAVRWEAKGLFATQKGDKVGVHEVVLDDVADMVMAWQDF